MRVCAASISTKNRSRRHSPSSSKICRPYRTVSSISIHQKQRMPPNWYVVTSETINVSYRPASGRLSVRRQVGRDITSDITIVWPIHPRIFVHFQSYDGFRRLYRLIPFHPLSIEQESPKTKTQPPSLILEYRHLNMRIYTRSDYHEKDISKHDQALSPLKKVLERLIGDMSAPSVREMSMDSIKMKVQAVQQATFHEMSSLDHLTAELINTRNSQLRWAHVHHVDISLHLIFLFILQDLLSK